MVAENANDPAFLVAKAALEARYGIQTEISAALDANGKGLFEPSKDLANPLAMILSAMMLRYTLDRPNQAMRIEKAITTVLHNGVRIGDIWQKGCQRVGTREMGDAVLRAM